ncbi:MAG: hypothetical protein R6Y91_09455 [Desulfohalobium sp.]
MGTTTIRIASDTHATLKKIAQEENASMQAVLNKILRKYHREQILHQTNEAFSALQNNPDAWTEEEQERALWEQTLADNQEPS